MVNTWTKSTEVNQKRWSIDIVKQRSASVVTKNIDMLNINFGAIYTEFPSTLLI